MGNIVASGAPQTVISKLSDSRRAIAANVVALEIAFPAGRSRDQDERDMISAIYMEAVAPFEPPIVLHVLKALRLHNHRNPFPPTPQDVFEKCQLTTSVLENAVVRFATEGGAWKIDPYPCKLPSGWFALDEPAPFVAGCIVPDDLARRWIQTGVQRLWTESSLRSFMAMTYRDLDRDWPHWRERTKTLQHIAALPSDLLDPQLAKDIGCALAHFQKLDRKIIDEREADRARRDAKYGRQVFANDEF